MTDQRLDEAFRALRAEVDGDSPDAEATLARVLSTSRAKAQRTRRTWMYLLPIAAVLAATSSWAAATGRIASMWGAPNTPDRVAVNDAPAPSAAARGELAPGNATTTAERPGADEAPAAAANDDAAAVAAPTDEARATDDQAATRGGAVATPNEAAERSRKARGEPTARAEASAAAAPSAIAAPPSPSSDPEAMTRATDPLRGPATPNPLAEDKADFQAAYRVHASGAAGAAVDAWNGYLSKHPAGRFVPEARYARAVALVRSGQRAAARDALRAFANGPPGSYRRDDAQKLLETIGDK